jgi:hypothetical protein
VGAWIEVRDVPSRIRLRAAALDFCFRTERESCTVAIDRDLATTLADPIPSVLSSAAGCR